MYLYVINRKSKGCLRFSESWGTCPCVPSLFYLKVYKMKVSSAIAGLTLCLRHAAGHSQCRCDGRQHTNGCLNCEFPKCLVLHGKHRFKLEIRNEK